MIDVLHDLLVGGRHGLGQRLGSFAVARKQHLQRIVRGLRVSESKEILRLVIDNDQRAILVRREMFDRTVRPRRFACTTKSRR